MKKKVKIDSVDEKKIVAVTVGFPVAVIGAVEALTFLIAVCQLIAGSGSYFKTALSSFEVGLSLNSSLRSSLAHGFGDAASQYVGNGFDLGKVDPYKAMVSGVFKSNASSVFLRSSVNSRNQNDYYPQISNPSDVATDFSLGMIGNRMNGTIGGFGLGELNANVGGLLEQGLKVGVNSAKTSVSVEIKKDIKSRN